MIEFEFNRSKNDLVYHQFDQNFEFGPHFHTSFEFIFVYEGELLIHINNKIFSLSSDTAILILPGQVHWIQTENHSKSYICIFSADNVPDFSNIMEKSELVNPMFRFPFKTLLDNFINSSNLFLQKSFLYLVCGLATESGSTEATHLKDKDLTRKIVEYVSEHYKEHITLKQMAKDLGYHHVYISSFFNKNLTIGFSKYINEHRIGFAKKLLRETDLSITQIANECGYYSIRNFNRAFMQIEHTSPKEYRLDISAH